MGWTVRESGCGRDFPHPSRPTLGLSSLIYNVYRDSPGDKVAGAWLDHHRVPRLKKEYSYTAIPLRAFVDCSRIKIVFSSINIKISVM
jgi:hypothetical protein